MYSIFTVLPAAITPNLHRSKNDIGSVSLRIDPIGRLRSNFQLQLHSKCQIEFSRISRISSLSNEQSIGEGDLEEESVDELRVPNNWLDPSKAMEVLYFFFL